MTTTQSLLGAGLAGRYEIERQIGAGGMATVYLARDVKHQRPVAVKLLNPELGAVLGADRFLSEIRVTANLQHPNLLPLFDSGEVNGLLFYVMPYVEGETLRSRIDREKQLPIDDAVRVATAVASALDYAHRHGVVHRDLKPENILLHDGQPLIADFGIALAVSNAGGERVTQTGLSLGTPQYMSPEQATGDRGVDGRTDIYSLGAVTYEMIGGEPAHHGTSAQAIIAKLMTEEARPLSSLRRAVPAGVAAAIHRALEKLPADRWQTAREFADALNDRRASIAEPVGVASHPVRGRRWIPWTIAAVALLVAGVVMWRGTRASPPQYMRMEIAQSPKNGAAASDFAFAPDGRAFAYSAVDASDSVRRIYVRRLEDLDARVFAGTETVSALAYSPDGQWIAFEAGRAVRKLNIASGSVSTMVLLDYEPYGISWGVDSVVVVSSGGRLFSIPVDGGKPRMIGSGDTLEFSRRAPLALPDGDHVIFSNTAASRAPLGIVSIRTGEARALALVGIPIALNGDVLLFVGASGNLEAARIDVRRATVTRAAVPTLTDIGGDESLTGAAVGGGNVVYAVARSPRDLVELRASGIRPLGVAPGMYGAVRRSPDGRRLAVALSSGGTTDIWIGAVGSATFDRLTSDGTNLRPEWSADSREVLFQSNRDGTSSLWQQSAVGLTPARKILSIPGAAIWEGVYTPDGSKLIYRTGSQTTADIWYRSVSGDTTPKPLATSKFGEDAARVSPDGKWVALTSTSSGRKEIYVMPFPALDQRVQVTHGGAGDPVWAGNNTLFYSRFPLQQDAAMIRSVTLAMEPEIRVLRTDSFPGGKLYAGSGHASFDALPDGKGVLVMRVLPGSLQVVLVTGYDARLNRLLKR